MDDMGLSIAGTGLRLLDKDNYQAKQRFKKRTKDKTA
jgi:hypothetical protein